MEEIDEEKKQKAEILAIKEFIIELKHNIRDIKEIKKGEIEKYEKTGQPAAST